MKYDDLLKQIDEIEYPWCMQDILRTVVELHKPIGLKQNDMCSICWEEDSFSILMQYPCPTIQTIEKELQ
jgi:hypothetical protein